jgi:hypothetical protein
MMISMRKSEPHPPSRACELSLFPGFWPASQAGFCIFLLVLQAAPAKPAEKYLW